MKVKEESGKGGLKLNIPIISWQIDGEIMADFIFLGSKITADGDCNHEIKRCLLLGRRAMTNLDSMLKSRGSTLQTNVHLVKTKIMASGPITLWQIDGETVETVTDCFLGLQNHCRW